MLRTLIIGSIALSGALSSVLADPLRPSIRASHVFHRQDGPESDYVVYGAKGAAQPGTRLIGLLGDGSIDTLGAISPDGSFTARFSYDRVARRLHLTTTSETSDTVVVRLDYPSQSTWPGRPNGYGFLGLAPAGADVGAELERLLTALRYTTEASANSTSSPALVSDPEEWGDISELPSGSSVVVYGYAPKGDSVTCIVGPTRLAVTGPISEGAFQVEIPGTELRLWKGYAWSPSAVTGPISERAFQVEIPLRLWEGYPWSPPSLVVNVTSRDNSTESTTSLNLSLPAWVPGS